MALAVYHILLITAVLVQLHKGTGVLDGLPDLDSMYSKASLIHGLIEPSGEQMVFTGIRFNCSGAIMRWTFFARERRVGENYPEVQIWTRSDGGNTYIRKGNSSAANARLKSPHIYESSLQVPLAFEADDVLGLYQPSISSNKFVLQCQDGGSLGKTLQLASGNPLDVIRMEDLDTRDSQKLYPLLALEFAGPTCVTGVLTEAGLAKVITIRPHYGEQRLFTGLSISCNTTVTKWMIGAQRRQLASSEEVQHPQVQIWRRRELDSNSFNQIDYRNITTSELEPTGTLNVYKYSPSPPFSALQKGDIVGLYQPERQHSEIVIFYQFDGGTVSYKHAVVEGVVPNQVLLGAEADNDLPLISIAETSVGSEEVGGCAFGFIDQQTLEDNALMIENLAESFGQQKIYPSINFTVDGFLLKWTFAARDLGETPARARYPQICVSRRQGSRNLYTTIHQTEMPPAGTGYLNTYEYILDPPLEFRAGDVVSVVHQQEQFCRLALVSLLGAGPSDTITVPLLRRRDTDTEALGGSEVPLIAVEIRTEHSVTTSTVLPFNTPYPMATTRVISPTTTMNPRPEGDNPPGDSEDAVPLGVLFGGVAGGTVIGILLVVLVAVIACLVYIVSSGKRRTSGPEETAGEGISFGEEVTTQAQPVQQEHNHLTPPATMECNLSISNPEYFITNRDQLQLPNGGYSLSRSGSYDSVYSDSGTGMHYEWGMYVPTQEQRRGLSAEETPNGQYTLVSHDRGLQFFEESDSYWKPASGQDEIYEQLANKKYREIQRRRIIIGGELGSGHFGMVNRGLWQTPSGHADVAVKTLKDGASETDRVKFLQEAAINGQFRHPNIVQLLGVVTLGDPIMIVLELLNNGDLKTNLERLAQSRRGKQEYTDLPNVLLGFCQDIASGMEYLASKAFVHRDLAARNILLADNGICKISDFGLSRDLDDEDYYISQNKGKIPIRWTAPEALHFGKYSTASDVWSYGVVVYEIWSLAHKPFEGNSNNESMQIVDSGYRLPPPPGCPREVYRIMIDCWHPEKSCRPTFSDLLWRLTAPSRGEYLLEWTEEDRRVHWKADVIGAPLEAGRSLYQDLQIAYLQPDSP